MTSFLGVPATPANVDYTNYQGGLSFARFTQKLLLFLGAFISSLAGSTGLQMSAQFSERIGPQRAEHQQSLHCEHAVKLAQRGERIRRPMQRHVRPQQSERRARHGQPGKVRAHRHRCPPPEKAQPRTAGVQHRARKIDRKHVRLAVALGERSRIAHGSTARIQHPARRQLHVIEALQHARTDFGFQPGGVRIAICRALEAAPGGARD